MSSCLDTDQETPEPQPRGFVSFYHGSPDAPDVNIQINGQQLNSKPFAYSSFSKYLPFNPGSVRVKFTQVNSEVALKEASLTVQDGKAYSVFLVDTLHQIDILVLKDSLVAPAVNKARVRFLNLSPDPSPVDLVTTGTSSTTLFGDVAFKENIEFQDVNAGILNLQVKNTGTGEVLLPVSDVDLTAGKAYTLVFRGFRSLPAGNPKGVNFQVLPVE